jgi:glutamyl-tRNA synthetase
MAILNFLFARKHGGEIVFRSEDTDRARSTREFEEDILDSLRWLGLSWDEFYRQSERAPIHRARLETLIAEDKAYLSTEESKQEPGNMVTVVRLRNPGKTVTFHDLVRGEITFDTTELGDFAIARSIDDPLYHFAVVVDDAEMGITHVIRGEDHISNTPRHILIQEALGYPRPHYAHFPLHLAADRSKLSKRKGDVAVRSYREKGYLPDALCNYLAVLGWTPPSGREILSKEQMMAEFELTDLHKSGAVFDLEKLRWFNRQYLHAMDDASFATYMLDALKARLGARPITWDERVGEALLPLLRERVSVADELDALVTEGEFDYFFVDPFPEAARIPDKKSDPEDARRHLAHARSVFAELPSSEWNAESLKSALWEYANAEGRGAVLWPLRYSLSGREKSPDPFMIASAIGKEAALRRIEHALLTLQAP